MRAVVGRIVGTLGVVALIGALGWLGLLWYSSRLPDTYSVMDYGTHEYGGGAVPAGDQEAHAGHGTSVAALTGREGAPDARFALTARHATIQLASGRTVDGLTFNGTSPGPELRVHEGDLVQVTLANADVEGGVTIHWHGVDVPNAEDGVAGVTQDAVLPGDSYTYRFRAEQAGTFWYHTHQASSKEVRRGLFGALVVEPPQQVKGLDLALVAHGYDGIETLNGDDGVAQRAVAPGTDVRLRLVNSESAPHRFDLGGTPFRVLAIDGTDLNGPTPLLGASVEVAAGGRADLGFAMPRTPVRLSLEGTEVGVAFSADGTALPPAAAPGPLFDPLTYGHPAPTPFGVSTRYDRRFDLSIGKKPGFVDGRPGLQWTIDGKIFPDDPVFVVEDGDLVEVEIENHTSGVHPMHLHGHHVLVLSRDGVPASGSPWWADTLNVKADESYVVAFRADNPGIWMDHCHNLSHAAEGLTMHVAYAGVVTPFHVGDTADNHPE